MPASSLFATTPKGMERLLARELRALGALRVRPGRAGAYFEGGLAVASRACLWSRLASRVLWPLARFPAPSPETLYEGVRAIHWDEHLAPAGTLAVRFEAVDSAITHSQFGALKVKDAIVDQLRERHGQRPSIDRERPDVRVHVYLHRDQASLGIDLSGEALHRRGYRQEGGPAPLKENLAAALLVCAGWPALAASGAPFEDPLCGSGTLPIEAALMAFDIAPGLLRPYFGFLGWRGHHPILWAELLEEARARRVAGLRDNVIAGSDSDPMAVQMARSHVVRARLAEKIRIERCALADLQPQAGRPGLVVANPPYGERLGRDPDLPRLYATLGDALKRAFPGWRAAVFTANLGLAHRLRVVPERTPVFYNGALRCRLYCFDVASSPRAVSPQSSVAAPPEAATVVGGTLSSRDPVEKDAGSQSKLGPIVAQAATRPEPIGVAVGAEMFANRLAKNMKSLARWARRAGVDCYRIYDADLPEFNLAIDLYQGEGRYVYVQEYEAPPHIDAARAASRLEAALAVITRLCEIPEAHVFVRQRRRQRGVGQYEKLAAGGALHEVRENGCRFLVNLTDYLDTGLFLDHRPTRALIGALARGRRFLNLFGYTGTATVYAALGGASSTTTVDLSRTYLDWARHNLDLNDITGPAHALVQADCLAWLEETTRTLPADERYGLIFTDPPTFSNSKRMPETFDVERDHFALLRAAVRLLAPDGVMIFSTNRRHMKLDEPAIAALGLRIEDLTHATIPPDFARNPRVHRCWRLSRG
ncbi:MAG: bifunctional 23S rRNA (guanine(2069)-N(7))-methyltransferase RlmK/23S rRNA (guanine(2445)-N(2))-methyltransferase RlmL [Gammaproteobacteria bacterium]